MLTGLGWVTLQVCPRLVHPHCTGAEPDVFRPAACDLFCCWAVGALLSGWRARSANSKPSPLSPLLRSSLWLPGPSARRLSRVSGTYSLFANVVEPLPSLTKNVE